MIRCICHGWQHRLIKLAKIKNATILYNKILILYIYTKIKNPTSKKVFINTTNNEEKTNFKTKTHQNLLYYLFKRNFKNLDDHYTGQVQDPLNKNKTLHIIKQIRPIEHNKYIVNMLNNKQYKQNTKSKIKCILNTIK